MPSHGYGAVWALGRHRLVCGDATDAAIARSALQGFAPRLMVTDPPYGVRYEPSWREDPRLHPFVGERRAKLATGKVLNDDRADWTEAFRLFPGDVAYVWHSRCRPRRWRTRSSPAAFERARRSSGTRAG
jgi:hypothetical protein